MVRVLAVPLGVVLFSALALAQNPAEPATSAGGSVSLEGRVVNVVTGEPVPRANLTIGVSLPRQGGMEGRGGGRQAGISAASDASGVFRFLTLPAGNYQLSARKTGFVNYDHRPDPGQPLAGAAGDEITGIEIKLMPQAVFSGRVLDEFGEPMANVQVMLLQQSGYFRRVSTVSGGAGGSTNALGEFLIGGLMPGKYILQANTRRMGGPPMSAAQTAPGEMAEGYVPTYYPRVARLDAAGAIAVGAGQHVAGMDIWMQKQAVFKVSGKVIGQDSTGPAPQRSRVDVSLEPQESAREDSMPGPAAMFRALRAEMNRDGEFEFASVPAGSYYLNATRMGQGGPPMNMRIPVDVFNGDVTGLTIQAAPAFLMEITGRVRMEGDGELPAQLSVSVQTPENSRSFIQPGRVQEDGTFKIERVPPGKYLVYVSPRADANLYTKQVTAGGADVLRNGLDLSQPQAAPVLDVVLSTKASRIEGVALRDGKPFPNASVSLAPEPLRPESRFFMSSARTDRNGRFTMRNLTPGNYKLYAWEEPVQLWTVPQQELQPYEPDAVSVRLAEGESKQVEVQVAAPR